MSHTSSRHVGYDMLRTLACVMVVILHASAQNWYLMPPAEPQWAFMHVWNTSTRGAVSVFFMISGALFLNAPPPNKKLWTRNIPRLLSVYILWSVLYGIDAMTLPAALANPARIIDYAMAGAYHLWFLPAMIGVYVLLPALYAVVHYENGWALRTYLPVFGVFGIICGTVAAFEGRLPWSLSVGFAKIVPELCGYCGYFILGYVLTKINPARLRRLPLIAVFCLSVAVTSAAGIIVSQRSGTATALLHDDFTVTTFLEAVSLFLLFRTVKISPESRTARIFVELSACTLGIYLLHPFVLERLLQFGFGTTIVHAGIGVPLVSAVVFIICLLVSAVLRRIPYAGKWML